MQLKVQQNDPGIGSQANLYRVDIAFKYFSHV